MQFSPRLLFLSKSKQKRSNRLFTPHTPHDSLRIGRRPTQRSRAITLSSTTAISISDDLRAQRGTNLLHAAVLPVGEAGRAERIQHEVLVAGGEVFDVRGRHGGDNVQLEGDLAAVGVEGEVVDVLAEGVLDFAADGREAEDDVCCDCFFISLLLYASSIWMDRWIEAGKGGEMEKYQLTQEW